jgi:signal transduction histidine kinase
MSLKRINLPGFNRLWPVLPYWVLILLFSCSCLGMVNLVLRRHEQHQAEKLLHHYATILQLHGPAGLRHAFATYSAENESFLRLTGQGIRLILVSNPGSRALQPLPDFSAFPPSASLTWHSLQRGEKKGAWSVAATEIDHNRILQVGIDSSAGRILLLTLYKSFFFLTLVFLLLSCIPAWFSRRIQSIRLRNVHEKVRALYQKKTPKNSPQESLEDIEKALLTEIDNLLSRHCQLSRELGESMDNVAHDLRTPITRLRTIAEYGLQKDDDPSHLKEALADCLEEADHLLSMLNTMLNVAEAEADTVNLDLKPLDLAETIRDVVDLYTILAEEKNVQLNFVPEPDIKILADRQWISQVWANLVDNALKYGATEITISTRKNNNMAQTVITDNGMGISANELPKIWNRLFRGDRSRSRPGLGLGLPLVRATVHNHNGTINVASTLNQGTTFTVCLPLAE